MIKGVLPYPPQAVARYRELGYWEDRSCWATYSESFERFADRVALCADGVEVSYAEVAARSTRLACHLDALGLSAGDSVIVQLPNSPQFLYLYFALQRLGVIPLLALPQHREHEIGSYVGFVEARALIVSADPAKFDFLGFARMIQSKHPRIEHLLCIGTRAPDDFVSVDTMLSSPAPNEGAPPHAGVVDPTDPCCFLLSGGTTGIPKVIARTHNDYVYNARVSAVANGIGADTRVLVSLPLAHNYPLNAAVHASWLCGGAVVLAPTPAATDALPLVEQFKVTHIEGVPAIWIKWLNDPVFDRCNFESVRVVNSAAQKLQPETYGRLEEAFPHTVVQEIFGLTEGLLMMNRLEDPEDWRRETIGRPISPGDEVRIVDEEGNDVADGEIGEMLCRGPYTLRGYFAAPEVNERMFTSDGYYRSGDLLRRDRSGNYIVEGRKKDLVNRGGEKISVEEVEDMLLALPNIRLVACVPMPDEVFGEKMCAFIVPEGELPTLDQLCSYLSERGLAQFKWPERLEIVDELPLSNIGKVQKNLLAARVADLVRRQ